MTIIILVNSIELLGELLGELSHELGNSIEPDVDKLDELWDY